MLYTVAAATGSPGLGADWEDPFWRGAETFKVANFRPESSTHRPRTLGRLLYDASGIHGIFKVHDRYVRCVRTRYFDKVWKDSCVEFFAEPRLEAGYFNFEFNCGGAFLCSYIVNPERTADGFKEFTRIPASIGETVRVRASLPPRLEPELTEPVTWTLRFFIPFALFERFAGPLGDVRGQTWRGNFFKCADESSHPHWASWSPLDQLNFHLPGCFGDIVFCP